MNHGAMMRARAANRLGAAAMMLVASSNPLFSSTSSDLLTISAGQIKRQSDYSAECGAIEDWRASIDCGYQDWLAEVQMQLATIESLAEGWDSNRALRPSEHLIEAAGGLIECLAQDGNLPKPHVNPTPAGGVQFEWEAGERYFELEVVTERAAKYFYSDDIAGVEVTGTVFEQESLEPVLAYIRGVATGA
jgi:hypothetical protein